VDGVDSIGFETTCSDNHLSHGVGNTDDSANPGMPVFPFVEKIERKGDAPVHHHQGKASDTGGGDQAHRVSAALVNVDDLGLVIVQVTPKPRHRPEVRDASQRQFDKGEACGGAGHFEVTTPGATDPDAMPPNGHAPGCRQHLHNRTGGEAVLVDQVQDAQLPRHARSIGV
jgi:hypothetical protein